MIKNFLSQFGLDTLRQLPDFGALEDAGLLSNEKLLAGDIPTGLTSLERDDELVEKALNRPLRLSFLDSLEAPINLAISPGL